MEASGWLASRSDYSTPAVRISGLKSDPASMW